MSQRQPETPIHHEVGIPKSYSYHFYNISENLIGFKNGFHKVQNRAIIAMELGQIMWITFKIISYSQFHFFILIY